MEETIKLSDHPSIQSALELSPGRKYMILITGVADMAHADEFQNHLEENGIDAVVVVLTEGIQLKVFDLS